MARYYLVHVRASNITEIARSKGELERLIGKCAACG